MEGDTKTTENLTADNQTSNENNQSVLNKTDKNMWLSEETLNKECLTGCKPYLCENMDAKEMVIRLQSKHILNQRKADFILTGRTHYDENLELIRFVKRGGKEAYNGFMVCLIETNQQHIHEKVLEERNSLALCKNIRKPSTDNWYTRMQYRFKNRYIFATTFVGLVALLAGICYLSYFCISMYQGQCSNRANLSSIQESLRESYQERFRTVAPFSQPFTFDTESNWVDLTLQVDKGSINTTKELANFLKNEFKKVKMVILEADPAAGKTALVHRIALEWARKEPQWKRYDLVLYAEFRRVREKNFTKITDLLDDYLSSYLHDEDSKQLSQFIHDNKCSKEYEILVLLDGYDESSLKDQCKELTDYLFSVTKGRSLLFKVMLTSRKGYLTDLRGQGRAAFAEVLGFTTAKQKEDFIRNFFVAKYSIQSAEKIKHVHDLLGKNENLKRLADTPLLLTSICLLYDKLKDGSELELYMNIIWWFIDRHQKDNPDKNVPLLFGFKAKTNEAKDHIIAKNYKQFPQLHRLGRMGMEDIFKSTFNETDLETFNISTIAQEVGLLRKQEMRVDTFHKKIEYSFPHRTIQEFLTAFAFFYSAEEPPEHFPVYFLHPWDSVGCGIVQEELQSFLQMIGNSSIQVSRSRKEIFEKIIEHPIHMDHTENKTAAGVHQVKSHVKCNDVKGIPSSVNEAVNFLKKEAQEGIAKAQYSLGIIYHRGRIVKQNIQEAIKWWKKAAEQNDTQAQLNLGAMYANGEGVDQSYVEAVKWYRKAAEEDHPYGQLALGYMYENGLGVPRSYDEAKKWFTKAAEQGNAEAQLKVGYQHNRGKTVYQYDDEEQEDDDQSYEDTTGRGYSKV